MEKNQFDFIETQPSYQSVIRFSESTIQLLVDSLEFERNMLSSNTQIQFVWRSLPRLLNKIPRGLCDESIMRMCAATASGLLDCSINHAWNAVIETLRKKVQNLGFHTASQFVCEKIDETTFNKMSDRTFLSHCHKLNIISNNGFDKLNECRENRNLYSAAHPTTQLNNKKRFDFDFVSFLELCVYYAFIGKQNSTAINIEEFVKFINSRSTESEQINHWNEQVVKTFDVQQFAVFKMLYITFCNTLRENNERETLLILGKSLADRVAPKIRLTLYAQHNKYLKEEKNDQIAASKYFIEFLGLNEYLKGIQG